MSNTQIDLLYYPQRFIEGLQDEYKFAILVQHPSTLDTVCVLAQFQEEVAGASRRSYRRPDAALAARPAWPAPLALPAPPPRPAGRNFW